MYIAMLGALQPMHVRKHKADSLFNQACLCSSHVLHTKPGSLKDPALALAAAARSKARPCLTDHGSSKKLGKSTHAGQAGATSARAVQLVKHILLQ